jgi:subtilisin family serine protease
MAKKKSAPQKSEGTRTAEQVSRAFARTTVPHDLGNAETRRKWGLPPLDEPHRRGYYIVELNLEHSGGLPGAASAFLALFEDELGQAQDSTPPRRKKRSSAAGNDVSTATPPPLRIAKSFYRCELSDHEWRTLIGADEAKDRRSRSIYRLWPDFPVSAQTDRSTVTIKADAALRSFDAGGTGIVWAVLDSGIDAAHPHFGKRGTPKAEATHSLLAPAVKDLHRSYIDVERSVGEITVNDGPLVDPDADPNTTPEARARILEQHRVQALSDPFGHGTHVAGIIAGASPEDRGDVTVFERRVSVDQGDQSTQMFATRTLPASASLRGVAPQALLVSLRVLDSNGDGRASQVIQALEYIREQINDNPKLLRVHGVNLSVGYEFDPEMFACGQSPLCVVVDRLVQQGVVVVAAAGNSGYGTVAAAFSDVKQAGLSNTINDPGNAALALTVGSTHRESPHLYGVSYFSSKGPTGDGRLKPDLVAPGERITSCAAGKKLAQAAGSAKRSKSAAYYCDDSGTSMAAPHVSGAVAAFLSIRREFIGRPLDVKRIFMESATDLGRERYFQGQGLIDLMRAIQKV